MSKKLFVRRKKAPVPIEEVVEPGRIDSISFLKAYPEAAAMWLYSKNCGFGPEDFGQGSNVIAWFKCPNGSDHIFKVSIYTVSRAFKTNSFAGGCGFCRGLKVSKTNNLAARFPDIAREWLTEKNGAPPSSVSFGSQKEVWWRCKFGHVWKASVANRTTNDSGCSICNRGAPTDLREYPEVLKEFDKAKNKGINLYSLPVGLKVWWKCSKDSSHAWKSGFYRTDKGIRCPYCANKKASKSNNLRKTHPHLAKQWDKLENDRGPDEVTEGSSYRASWICKKGPDHKWQTKVIDRVLYETGCPFCSFRKTSVTNVISTVAPHLVPEWHKARNGKSTPQNERAHSRVARWWKCKKCSHIWKAEPYRRVIRGSGCPRCSSFLSIKRLNSNRALR